MGFFHRHFGKLKKYVRKVPVECISDTFSSDDYDPTSLSVQIKPKPWYFKNGSRYPDPPSFSEQMGKRAAKLMQFEDDKNDRFTNQMMFVPPNYESIVKSQKFKTILGYTEIPGFWGVKLGTEIFKDFKCPVYTCRLTNKKEEIHTAEMVFFYNYYVAPNATRSPEQIYALYHMVKFHFKLKRKNLTFIKSHFKTFFQL